MKTRTRTVIFWATVVALVAWGHLFGAGCATIPAGEDCPAGRVGEWSRDSSQLEPVCCPVGHDEAEECE